MSENRGSAAWAGADVVNVHEGAIARSGRFKLDAPLDVSGDQGAAVDALS